MTSLESPITSTEELHEALQAVLLRAYEGGIDVEGGFECRNGAEPPDWDVNVTELEKTEHSEGSTASET